MRVQRKGAFLVVLILLVVEWVAPPAHAQGITLGAGVELQSPDGRLIRVNGVFISEEGHGLGWFYDWGDGSTTTGFFPTLHRFEAHGVYTVTVTAFNDLGASETITFTHAVPEPAPSEVASVELSNYVLGLQAGEFYAVDVVPRNASGDPLSLDGRSVEVFNTESSHVSAAFQDGVLRLTAPVFPDRDAWSSTVYVYVDGQEAMSPVHVIVNSNEGLFDLLHGAFTASYLPTDFFTTSLVPDGDYVGILDWAFELENETVQSGWVEEGRVLQGISYAPSVFGTSGNPLHLGDFALPQDGIPFLDVIFHEMGHNFHSIPVLFNAIAIPGPFYQETIAQWYVQYVLNVIIEERSEELTDEALQVLEQLRQRGRDYHVFEYQQYIDRGMPFDYFAIENGSHPLVQKVYEYSDIHGWDKLEEFMVRFDHSLMSAYGAVLSQHGGLEPVVNRVTIMAAALSSTFGFDVRPDLRGLSFPLNDALYADLLDAYGTPVDSSDPGSQSTRAFGLDQNHPNPFVSTTWISFELPAASPVTLTVYDLLGRRVELLLDEHTAGGTHRVRWDASGLAGGSYLYRLQAGDLTDTKVMTYVE